jgi:surface protein
MQLNYDAQQQHIIKVTVSDGTNTVETTVTINVEEALPLADDPTSFVTTWQTTEDFESIYIGTDDNLTYNYTIDWGDGWVQELTNSNPSHQYDKAGIYTIAIKGEFPRINMNQNPNAPKLMSIEQWGSIEWQSMETSFFGCENMVYNATDIPNLTNVTSTFNMFGHCYNFNGDLSGWDVSSITNMKAMFNSASAFNQNITDWNWDVSNVTDMSYMFQAALSFDQNLSAWDIGNVTDMTSMLDYCGMSPENLNTTLLGWFNYVEQNNSPTGITLGVANLSACGIDPYVAALTLDQTYGWNIVGATFEENCN